MFQIVINKILQDLINTEEVVSFIDGMIVKIEEEEYNEVVEEVVKRLIENNLYIKPKKYKWKVKEVGFLGVVTEPEEIKVKEKKIKAVLDQLNFKRIKNVQKFLRLASYYKQFIGDFLFIVDCYMIQ